MSNLLNLAFVSGRLPEVSGIWSRYLRATTADTAFVHEYNELMYEGFREFAASPTDAQEKFRRQILLSAQRGANARYLSMAYINLAKAQAAGGDYAGAITTLLASDTVVDRSIMPDAGIEVCRLLAEWYDVTGNRENAVSYRMRHYMLKDSLLTYQRLQNFGSQEFINRLDEARLEIADINAKRHRQARMLIFTVTFLAVTAGFGTVIYRKNRRLQVSLDRLYQDNVSKIDTSSPPVTPAPKYRGSQLEEADKQSIMSHIRQVLTDSPEVCTSSFNLVRLSELVGQSYKRVSQVINEMSGKNLIPWSTNTAFVRHADALPTMKITDI